MDVRLGPRDQDGQKTDCGWLTLEDINKQEHIRVLDYVDQVKMIVDQVKQRGKKTW
jgi:hypothetical protein